MPRSPCTTAEVREDLTLPSDYHHVSSLDVARISRRKRTIVCRAIARRAPRCVAVSVLQRNGADQRTPCRSQIPCLVGTATAADWDCAHLFLQRAFCLTTKRPPTRTQTDVILSAARLRALAMIKAWEFDL